MTRRLRRELGLAVPWGVHTFLSMAKEKCAKESQRHGDSRGGPPRFALFANIGVPGTAVPGSCICSGLPVANCLRQLCPLGTRSLSAQASACFCQWTRSFSVYPPVLGLMESFQTWVLSRWTALSFCQRMRAAHRGSPTAIKNTPGTEEGQSRASSDLDLALAAKTAFEGRAIVAPDLPRLLDASLK